MNTAVRPLVAGFPLLLIVTACDLLTGPGAGAIDVTTDRSSYVAEYLGGEGSDRQYGFDLTAAITNRGGTTLYLARCFPDSAEPLFHVGLATPSSSESSAYVNVWACVGHENHIRLEPRQTMTYTFHIVGPGSWDGRTGTPFGTLEGDMRLQLPVQSCEESSCDLDRESAKSNSFHVEVGAAT